MSSTLVPEQTDGVIQSPDGEIHYYSQIKNKHNPYIQNLPLDEESNIEYIEIMCNGDTMLISVTDINNAIKLECKASVVRFLCLFDFIINIFISFSTYYMSLFSPFIAGISLLGYYSTITYNRKGLVLYLIYQYIQSISKIVLLTIYSVAATSPEFKQILEDEHIKILDPTITNILLFSLATLGQMYITYFIQDFYNVLPDYRRLMVRSEESELDG